MRLVNWVMCECVCVCVSECIARASPVTMPKNAQLIALAQRRNLRVPAAECRVDRRGLWQFFEVRERWEGRDPRCYTEVVAWFRGTSDRPGKPRGAQFWLDLCAHCGQDRAPYDEVSVNDPMKITVEHWYSQSMAGDRHGLLHGWMNLHAVEWGFNNSLDFKSSDSPAEQQFLGLRAYRMHRSFLNWFNTCRNSELPTLSFLQSTHCTDTDMATPIYLSSGLRHSGLTRQLFLPFGAAQGLRSGVKRARVEEVVEAQEGEAQEGEAEEAQEEAPAPEPMTREVATQTDPDEVLRALKSAIARYEVGARRASRCAAGQPGSGARRGRGCQQRPGGRLGGRGRQRRRHGEGRGRRRRRRRGGRQDAVRGRGRRAAGRAVTARRKAAAGNRRVVKPSRCSWPGCKDGFNVARQRGYTFCGKKGGVGGRATGCIAKAKRLEREVGKEAREGAMERVPQAARGHGGAPGALGPGCVVVGFFRLVIRVNACPKKPTGSTPPHPCAHGRSRSGGDHGRSLVRRNGTQRRRRRR